MKVENPEKAAKALREAADLYDINFGWCQNAAMTMQDGVTCFCASEAIRIAVSPEIANQERWIRAEWEDALVAFANYLESKGYWTAVGTDVPDFDRRYNFGWSTTVGFNDVDGRTMYTVQTELRAAADALEGR